MAEVVGARQINEFVGSEKDDRIKVVNYASRATLERQSLKTSRDITRDHSLTLMHRGQSFESFAPCHAVSCLRNKGNSYIRL